MFQLQFNTDNADFAGDAAPTIAYICEAIAAKVRRGVVSGPVFDANGNKIGAFEFDGSCEVEVE